MTGRRDASGVWLFGYGSLVSRASFEHTLGRHVTPGDDFLEAEVDGFARRWAYSIRSVPAAAADPPSHRPLGGEWTVTVLGLEDGESEAVNGVIGWVTNRELAAFDDREGTYRRIDVTAVTRCGAARQRPGPVVTYVPTATPIERYERARAHGAAVVDANYWHLVDRAFEGLGAEQYQRYRATTPAPDVPIVRLSPEHVPGSHLPAGD